MTMRSIHRYFKLLGLPLLICFILITPVAAQDPPPPQPETQPAFDPRFGVVDSFVNTTEANAAGVGWTRVFFRWDVVQVGGATDWKPTNVPDTFLNAEIAAGREIAAVLIGTPAWATESGTSTAVPPLELWGDFVFKIATQYKGRINHWIIWNQPDIMDSSSPNYTWAGNEEDYYRLLKEAYLKIKAVDPAMQVHLAGLTYTWDQAQGNPQYLARLLDIIVADPQAANENHFFDGVSYHLYYNPTQMLEILTDVRSILDAHGLSHKPVWINETNAPPSEDFIEPPTGPAPFKITLEEQSAFVIQAFALALAGGAERIAFNKMRNERNHPESVVPFGLLRGDNSRRPAFDAFRTVTSHFAGVQETNWLQLGNIYLVTLDRGDQTTTVLWNTTTTPTSYTLNAIASQALLVDERGNTQTITASNGVFTLDLPGTSCTNGAYCFIGGAPRLVVEPGSPAQRAPLLPLTPPTATLTPLPTDTPMPTETPPPPPPTLTPVPEQTQAHLTVSASEPPASAAESAPPPAAALPDPDFDPSVPEADLTEDASAPTSATPTIVPPVTITTVLRPSRLLWLLIIGLIVFTVSYGVQVVIWYRMKR